ncbi:MAG: CYTH domain-containing protein [Anaerovoracaceae bacterium]
MHTREELNINLGEQSTMEPNPEVFRESDMGGELMDLLAGKSLLPMIEVNVLRRSFRVDTGESLLEISIDKGEILTESGSRPLREVEIELFSGEQKELEALGEKLKERYSLEPEKDSKFAKGLMLLGMLKQ